MDEKPMTATEVNALTAKGIAKHANELNEMGLKIIGPKSLALFEAAIARIKARAGKAN